jgi:hypothetical protein
MAQKRAHRQWFVFATATLMVAVVAGAAGYGTAPVSRLQQPPPTIKEESPPHLVHGTVLSRDTSTLRLTTSAGPRDLRLTGATALERLEPATFDGVRAGDWVNVGALPNKQTLFAITGLVLVPREVLEGKR